MTRKQPESDRTSAQIAAEQRYAEKRKAQARLPGGYLSDDEEALLSRVSKHFSSKKEAIFEGLKLLDKKFRK